jgi:hypothetical protein
MTQLDLLKPAHQKLFDDWSHTPGGRHVLQIAYALTARYARRYQQTGRRVSIRLVWESLRDQIVFIRARMKARGIMLEKLDGFALNDHLHAYVARHMVEHRKEWEGLFELRKFKE